MESVITNPNGDLEVEQYNEDREIATIYIHYKGQTVERDVVVINGELPEKMDMLLEDMVDTINKADGSIFN